MSIVFEMNALNSIFCKKEMFQPKCHWFEINYLGTIQNRHWQLICRHGNAFFQYMLSFASAIVTCRRELERLGTANLPYLSSLIG